MLRARARGIETTAPVLTLAVVSILFNDKARTLAAPSLPKSPLTNTEEFCPKLINEL